MDCNFCGRKGTKYRCILCENSVCNVCSDPGDEGDARYDEESYMVGKCPRGECSKKKDIRTEGNRRDE